MSEYSSLKATINANVKTNGKQEITGSVMNSVLNAMVNSLGAGYQFMGVATPTNPGSAQTPDYKCFYIATTPGTYTNLGRLVVADGEVAILKYDSSWTKEMTGIATMGKIESSVLLAGTRFQPTEIVGYIADNGIINPLSQFHSLITSKIPVKVGDAFTFRGRGNMAAPNAFLYNGDSLVSTQIVTGGILNVTIPNGITHIVFASFANSNDNISFNLVQTNPVSLKEEIDEIEEKLASMQLPVICIGDSVTEGMNMDGAGTADYGKAPYPAQIYTLLKDAGYKQSVINEGISGETTPAMIARCGGMPCVIMNDIALPADTSWVALGNSTTIAACNMYIPIKMLDGVTNYYVYFTGLNGVTTPVFIDGNNYNLKVEYANRNYYMSIQKISVANTATKIPAGSLLFTNCSKNPLLSVIFGGHNDRTELNFEKWSAMMDAGLATSANKGIVLGSHINIWHTWNDLTGTTDAEKHADFKTKSTQRFGMRFIDLYDDFFAHALDYCLAAGYFSDKTQAELDAMEAKLEQHIVPAEFSYDGQHEGNVHLNREGYYVIAKLVFDRLKAIHYI